MPAKRSLSPQSFNSLLPRKALHDQRKIEYIHSFADGTSLPTAEAITQYLQSPAGKNTRGFKVGGDEDRDLRAATTSSILASLTQSLSVEEVAVWGFSVGTDENSARALVNLIRNKSNLVTLRLVYGDFLLNQYILAAVADLLMHAESPLQCLELDLEFDIMRQRDGNPPLSPQMVTMLQSLFRAVALSTQLQRLHVACGKRLFTGLFGPVDTLQVSVPLPDLIPSFQVTELTLAFGFRPHKDLAGRVLKALQNNYTIQDVHTIQDVRSLRYYGLLVFDEANQTKLDINQRRNRQLALWKKDPASVPPHLQGHALKLAFDAGCDSLFVALLLEMSKHYLNQHTDDDGGSSLGTIVSEPEPDDVVLWDDGNNVEEPPSPPKDGRLSWRMAPEESFSDWTIEIIVEGRTYKTYHVHKAFLAAGHKKSEYFAMLFQTANISGTHTIMIELKKIAAAFTKQQSGV